MYTRRVEYRARRWLGRCGLAACVLTAGADPAAGGQAEGAEPARLAVTATGRDGALRTGLQGADFELLVDGEPQPIEGAQLRRAAPDEPRTFAFVLDEFHTPAEASAAVRVSLLRFVDRLVRPADRLLVVKPLDSLARIQPAPDRDAVRAAIAGFSGRKGDFTPRTAFEREYMAHAPEAVAAARAQIVTAALRAIGTSLPATDGARAAIVLVSDGFARLPSGREMPAGLHAALRILNRAGAPLYALTPSGTPETEPHSGAQAALAALANGTGGLLAAGTGAMDAALARMAGDLDAHYVLEYRPAHGEDGRFHTVAVKPRRAGITVRARSGYVAPAPADARAPRAPDAATPLRVLRRSGHIQSWAGVFPQADGRAVVMITWEPAVPRGARSTRPRAVSVVLTAATSDGTVLFDGVVAPVGGAGGPHLPDRARFETGVGPVRVDVKILDAKGVVIDTDSRDVTVAAPRASGPTLYPAAVLRTRSAREFRDVATDPSAAAVPSREFRRTERLLIRVPAVHPSGAPAAVDAVLLNRIRQPIRGLKPMASDVPAGVTQFDLPLAPLAPGDYALRLTASGPSGTVAEYVTFRVGG